ncbi:MAG: hypothetical protein RMX98_036300 [Nostoc sp. DedQUE02]
MGDSFDGQPARIAYLCFTSPNQKTQTFWDFEQCSRLYVQCLYAISIYVIIISDRIVPVA